MLDYTAQNVYKGNAAMMNYYSAVADGALRGVADRPMILKRFVKGIAEACVVGEAFDRTAPK